MVTLVKFNDGSFVKQNANKADWSAFRLKSTTLVVDEKTGILTPRKRYAIVGIKTEHIAQIGLLHEGRDMSSLYKLINIETLAPNPKKANHTPMINPETKAVVLNAQGMPIYSETKAVPANSTQVDVIMSRLASRTAVAAVQQLVVEEGDDA
jgi:hypothetical protein